MSARGWKADEAEAKALRMFFNRSTRRCPNCGYPEAIAICYDHQDELMWETDCTMCGYQECDDSYHGVCSFASDRASRIGALYWETERDDCLIPFESVIHALTVRTEYENRASREPFLRCYYSEAGSDGVYRRYYIAGAPQPGEAMSTDADADYDRIPCTAHAAG